MIRMGAALAMLAGPIGAQTLCETLDTLDAGELVLRQGVASCQNSLALGGVTNIHCMLTFPYRSDDARTAFEDLVDELADCLGPNATVQDDQLVNHPDAYDLRLFEMDGRTYAVSIKDKGALQQTMVFLRAEQE